MSFVLLDDAAKKSLQQLHDETIEALQLAKQSPDLDDLAAVYAVALLKLGNRGGHPEAV